MADSERLFCSHSMRLVIIMHRFIWAGSWARSYSIYSLLGDRILNNKIWLTWHSVQKTSTAKKGSDRHTLIRMAITILLWCVSATRQIYCDHFNLKTALHINKVTIIWFWWHSNEWNGSKPYEITHRKSGNSNKNNCAWIANVVPI